METKHGVSGVYTDGNVACVALPWRYCGRLYATVVVKATFALKPGTQAVPASPATIVQQDRTFGDHPARSVERAQETAPSLSRCDVLFTGHAWGNGRTSAAARLAIYHEQTPLLDRTVHVLGDRDPSGSPSPFQRIPLVYERAFGGPGVADNPVGTQEPNLLDPLDPRKPACFAPIPRAWPARKRQLAALDPAARAGLAAASPGAILEVPGTVPWSYFQAAPADQQMDYLHGDEWVVLDGVHPTQPSVRAQLMGAVAAARVRVGGAETPLSLAADMLVIDGDRLACSIVWRGRHELPDEQALSSLVILAGLQLPGQPLDWTRIAPQRPVRPIARPAAPAAAEGTVTLRPAEEAIALRKPLAPFRVAAPESEPAARAKDANATPWGDTPLQPVDAPVGEETIAAPESPPDAAPRRSEYVPPLDAKGWARTSARLIKLSRGDARKVLAELGLDEHVFRACDEHYQRELAADVESGALVLAALYGACCAEEMRMRNVGPRGAPAPAARRGRPGEAPRTGETPGEPAPRVEVVTPSYMLPGTGRP